jgi:hypothetical protein
MFALFVLPGTLFCRFFQRPRGKKAECALGMGPSYQTFHLKNDFHRSYNIDFSVAYVDDQK